MKAVLFGPPGSTILETTPFTIGSSPDNSLVIDSIKVSAHHAEIRLEEQGYTITDLGSIHGTYVNGERLDFNTPRLLNSGNSISFGESIFTYNEEETPQPEETMTASSSQYEDSKTSSNEKMETLPSADSVIAMSGPLENQELVDESTQYALSQQTLVTHSMESEKTLFIPKDYDGPIPGYLPIKQVRRRDRRFIVLGIGLLALFVLAVGGYFYFTRSTPEKTLDAFCNAIQGQDYQTAYNQFSNSLQNNETELEFANTSRAEGKVNTCTHSSANIANNKATADVKLINNSGQQSKFNILLATDKGNTWKMSLFPTTPIMTLTTFCNALQNKDLPTAYSQLTSGIKRQHAEAQFETDFTGLTCSYANISPSGSAQSATLTFRNAAGQAANAKVSLIQDGESSNIWKINSIQF